MHLPTTFGAETSWQWESNNADKFGSFVGVGYRDHITSTENLERYNFQYLWQKDFGHATFVILDEDVETEDSLKKEFWKNLTDALQRSKDEMLVSRSASALKIAEKTTFVKVSDGHREKIEELLQSIPCDGTLPVNSLWFFRALGDGAIISAVSPIDPESKKASIIEFLTFSESRRLAWKIDEILEEYLLFPELRQSHAKIP
jgi:hypothetical protein